MTIKERELDNLCKQSLDLDKKIRKLKQEITQDIVNSKIRTGSKIEIPMRDGSGFKFIVEDIKIDGFYIRVFGNGNCFTFTRNVYNNRNIEDKWGRNIRVLEY